MDLASLRRILIVKPSSLGDIIHTLPLLAVLRREAPEAELRWLVNSAWAPLLQEHPLLDGLIEFPRDEIRGWKAPARYRSWKRRLDWRPDLALDVQGLMRSALLARATGASRIVGYNDAREGANLFHHEVVDVSRKRSPHAVDRYLSVLDAWNLERPETIEFPLPEGRAPAQVEQLPESFVVLHPFSRGEGKSLSPSQTEHLVQGMGMPVVVVGRSEGIHLELEPPHRNLLNSTSLPELIWILRQARWVISVDSGPMHLAAALNSRLLAIHTWSDPEKVGPYRKEAWIWKDSQIFQAGEGTPAGTDQSGSFPDEAVGKILHFVQEHLDS